MSEAIYYALDKLLIVAAIASVVMWTRVLIRGPGESSSLIESIVPVRGREPSDWIQVIAGALVMFGTHMILYLSLLTFMISQGWIETPAGNDQIDPPHAESAAASNASILAVSALNVAAGLASIVVTLTFLYLMDSRSVRRLGLSICPPDVRLGLMASVMLLPPVLMISALVSLLWPYDHEVLDLLQNVKSPTIFLGMFFATAIVTPGFEEMLFRVLIQGGLQRMIDRDETVAAEPASDAWRPRSYLPIVIASAIFALMHLGQGAAPIPLFFLSLGLGYLYRQTGNITAPLVVHMALNSLTMIANFTETTGAGS